MTVCHFMAIHAAQDGRLFEKYKMNCNNIEMSASRHLSRTIFLDDNVCFTHLPEALLIHTHTGFFFSARQCWWLHKKHRIIIYVEKICCLFDLNVYDPE